MLDSPSERQPPGCLVDLAFVAGLFWFPAWLPIMCVVRPPVYFAIAVPLVGAGVAFWSRYWTGRMGRGLPITAWNVLLQFLLVPIAWAVGDFVCQGFGLGL